VGPALAGLARQPHRGWTAVGPRLALQPPRSRSWEPHVELSSAPLELKANTRYELLSRIGICDGTPARVACLEEEYHRLGAFETGIVFDHKPASLSPIHEAAGRAPCAISLSVVASHDLSAKRAALRGR
jgi:hypothetical protein